MPVLLFFSPLNFSLKVKLMIFTYVEAEKIPDSLAKTLAE